jgi:LCP family protein required for cell wall assembly
LIFGITAFAVAAFYLALVVVTAADDVLFPGNEIKPGILARIVPGVDSGENPESADIEERINILVLGLDLRRDESADLPARTDSVFVLTVDPFSKTAGIFSIPRDLLVEIPNGDGGYVESRINVAYELGQFTYEDYPGGGPGLAVDTIERNFGIPIDYYVVLNFNNFVGLIDEIGGIDVEVPDFVFDPEYSDCNACTPYYLEFVPGQEHMDGERALAYARIRHSDDDFKRIERQQLVIRATANKTLELGILLSEDLLGLYKQYKQTVKTDIPDFKIGGLALLVHQVGVDNIRTVSIAGATYPCESCSAAVLRADWAMVAELQASVFEDGQLQKEGARVEVQNGTGTPGLADDFAAFFRRQGLAKDQIVVDEYGDGSLYESTLVVNLNGKTYTAERIAEWLNLPVDRIKTAADPEAAPFLGSSGDVVVVLGADVSLPSVAALPGG